MSDISILTRRSYYFHEDKSEKLHVYVKQQKLIRALKTMNVPELDFEEMLDKIIDCNDQCILKIYEDLITLGIEKTMINIRKLRMSKNK